MTVRVRFAPSPTGYLHIGGARTALYNFLLAKAQGGKYIVRVEDTDIERSKREYEDALITELKWLGIEHDIGPGLDDGKGPYRQSERLDLYMKYALELVERGDAFYDFCSQDEIDQMREKAEAQGTAPYTGKWRDDAHFAEAKAKVEAGEKTAIRFKVDPTKSYEFKDLVRSNVKFPPGMVGDFVIMRANAKPTYNFCNVIDDHLHEMTHILRGEEHLNNTVRQLMIYEAFDWTPPKFAHLSIMIGEDRQKLSKRHGATSVNLYKDEGYLPQALMNYLCLLGWSHPDEKSIFTIADLIEVFDDTRFNKSPAMYDIEKLKWTNAQHLKLLTPEELLAHANEFLVDDEIFSTKSDEWKTTCLNLFVEKIQVITDLAPMLKEYLFQTNFEKNEEIEGWESTPLIAKHLQEQINSLSEDHVSGDVFGEWMNYCKKELKIKGKPLFMGLRYCLTGQDHGPDLKVLIPLINKEVLAKRLTRF
jgi:nondiscriminating glutamyl-tRNA synthetase